MVSTLSKATITGLVCGTFGLGLGGVWAASAGTAEHEPMQRLPQLSSLSNLMQSEVKPDPTATRSEDPADKDAAMDKQAQSRTQAPARVRSAGDANPDQGLLERASPLSVKRLVVKGAFHGRTEAPALYSDSTRKAYRNALASYRHEDSVLVVAPYDIDALKQAFADADAQGWFIEAMFLEPVMGEGDPGRSVPVDFYAAARELTKAHGSLLLVDSIQAGLRATGALSIVDYPGFDNQEAPDMETYSKALNAGQFPLSVLAVNERAAGIYKRGTYGNTMTGNPRAADVGVAVLGMVTPEVRANIRTRGKQAIEKLESLKAELGGLITKVQGTGLLFSCELAPEFKGYGAGSTEEWLRERGLGVIHGGENSLRFTPRFEMGEDELDLVVSLVKRALLEGPRVKAAA